MKSKLTIFFAFLLMLSLAAFSQAPNSFKYQSMVRKVDGSALANQSVKVKISILKGSTSGTSVYSEVHSSTSNAFGIVNLNIGEGSEKSGTISTIDWSTDLYFVKIEMDETGGVNYTLSSVSQLLSVPYALFAAKSGNGFSGNYNELANKPDLSKFDKDSTNELQALSIKGDTIFLSQKGGFIKLPSNFLKGNTLRLSAVVKNNSCNNTRDGSINTTVTGGNPPYIYEWVANVQYDFKSNSEDLTELYADDYSLVVTDQDGYSLNRVFRVSAPSSISVTDTIKLTTDSLVSNGAISLTIVGGTAPYSYNWSNSDSSKNISGLQFGSYSVNISDANNCPYSSSYVVDVKPKVKISYDSIYCKVIPAPVQGQGATINILSGVIPNTSSEIWYSLNGGAFQKKDCYPPYCYYPEGTYKLFIKSGSKYSVSSDTISFKVYADNINVTPTVTNATSGLSDGSIMLNVTGNLGVLTYQWKRTIDNTIVSTNKDLSNQSADKYELKILSSNGCSFTEIYTIETKK